MNRAYETLRDPVRGPSTCSPVRRASSSDDKSVPAELLGEVMMLREEIEEAKQANDQAALQILLERITARQQDAGEHRRLASQVLRVRQRAERSELRQQLNAISTGTTCCGSYRRSDEY